MRGFLIAFISGACVAAPAAASAQTLPSEPVRVLDGRLVLTGEAASDRGVRPRRNFDPGRSNGWGALQIAARYNELKVSRNAVDLGFAAAGASRTAEAFAVGANWYLNPFVKWVLNFERTIFDGEADGPRPAENALLFRAQLSF